MVKQTRKKEDLTYEKAFAELEEIIDKLENEEHPLEEAMRLFERGQFLAKFCADYLDKAELKVKQLSGDSLVSFEEKESTTNR